MFLNQLKIDRIAFLSLKRHNRIGRMFWQIDYIILLYNSLPILFKHIFAFSSEAYGKTIILFIPKNSLFFIV